MQAARANQRIAQRFYLANERICKLSLADSSFEVVGNISYGGFNVLYPTGNKPQCIVEAASGRKPYALHFLGHKLTGEALRVYAGESSAGFAFCHESPETLIFFNPYLEKMRLGSTLNLVPQHLRKDAYKEDGWHCFHGDGPVDLRLQCKNGEVLEAIASFRIGEDYYDVIYRDKKYSTRYSIDKEGVGARTAQSQEVDPKSMRHFVCILIGLCNIKQASELNFLMNEALDALKL